MKFTVIENRERWLEKVPQDMYPYSSRWINFWRDQKKKCIEGKWEKDFDGYRYMSGPLFFYIHYCTIIDFDRNLQINKKIRPLLRDTEWEYSYLQMVCKGFSGFEEDQEVCCNITLKKYYEGKVDKSSLTKDCYNSEGSLKEYEDAITYIRRLHDHPKGKPIYMNEAQNAMILGSRGGGKSYYWALAGLKHNVIFDGKKYYIKDKSVSDNIIVSGESSKSGKTIRLVPTSINVMKTSTELGAYGKETDSDFVVHPFYKEFTGDLKQGNGSNPFAHRYKVKSEKGGWTIHEGSKIVHGVITIDSPEVSAGERVEFTLVEEVGLISNITTFHMSNEASQIRGIKYGYTTYIGTAGNMKKIREARNLFTNPHDYDIVAYDDDYEFKGSIGFFLPAYYTNNRFKDEHGNTKVDEAKAYYLERREQRRGNQDKYQGEIMNYPLVPSEMFITDSFNILPAGEASKMEEFLTRNKVGATIDLFWVDGDKVDYKVNNKQEVPYPYRPEKDNAEGTIVIYDMPIKVPYRDKINGKLEYYTPKDAYIVSLDPYATDSEKDSRNSLGASYVMINPRYHDYLKTKHIIAASYIARPAMGRKVFLQNLEKLLAFYGNPVHGLWYENDRGDHVKDYFEKKNKLHLLAIDRVSQNIRSNVTRYGWNMGNGHKKIDRIDTLADFLCSESTIMGEKKMNIHRIPDLYAHREIIRFDVDSKANYDRLVGLIGCAVGLKNSYNSLKEEMQEKHTSNRLDFLANNKIFKNGKNNYKPALI